MKLVRTTASISYEEANERIGEFEKEFDSFSSTDTNPVDDFIQKMKAREGKNAPDEMTILLLGELHKKIDDLTRIVKGDKKTFIPLKYNLSLEFAWFDIIKLDNLKEGQLYYARINLPLFRPREIPFFFEATDGEHGKIVKMWPQDKADFDGYLASKDREEIARDRAFK